MLKHQLLTQKDFIAAPEQKKISTGREFGEYNLHRVRMYRFLQDNVSGIRYQNST